MTAAAAPDLLSRFSRSVRAVTGDLQATPVPAAEIAYALLRAHPEYIDGELTVEPGGPARPVMDWLWHCWSLYDPDKTGGIVDGRLLILALARIDDRLNAALRRGGRRRLELPRTFTAMAWGWAQPSRVREYAEIMAFPPAQGCVLSADGGRLATIAEDGRVEVRDVAGDIVRSTHVAAPRFVAFSPTADVVAIAAEAGVFMFEEELRLLTPDPAGHCTFSPDGRLLACARPDRLMLWAVDGSDATRIPYGGAVSSAFSHDGAYVAIAARDRVRVWDIAAGIQAYELRSSSIRGSAFTPDGRRLLTVGDSVQLWELATGRGRKLAPIGGEWALSPDGRLLVDTDGAIDVATGRRRSDLPGGRFAFSRDGRFLATADGRVLEILTGARDLPAVAPDIDSGRDLLGLEADANALADVIAAESTKPPLSIGLFADWGSGKSFLIHLVQQRVRELSARAARATDSAHCAHVRNVEFNAWHYADANLWASLATHILDQLAKPDGDADSAENAAFRATRLLEEITRSSSERDELARASAVAARAQARRKLLFWTWGLAAGKDTTTTLEQVSGGLGRVGSTVKLLLPTVWSRLIVTLVPLVVVGAVLGVVGVDEAVRAAAAVGAAITAVTGWVGLGALRVKRLVDRAGASTAVQDVRSSDAKAELRAAEARVEQLRGELADLTSGRRLARFAAERAAVGDYRSQLSVVSRVRDDFERMSGILKAQADLDTKDAAADDLPRIDRIVLYIDDLDRCPPSRVVQVLEAVHLILALELFVVVLAVDPRWLLQSLELHYSELLAEHEDERWKSSPLNYLEKIIQLPFTLRPMSAEGVAALVGGLLPVAAPEVPPQPLPGAADEPTADATEPAPPRPPERPPSAVAPAPLANVNPRTLALTPVERDFATVVARQLKTPRAVKKLTNLYRLLRARLDEDSGELDAFLDRRGPDVPECEAALILLAVLIAFPSEASTLLLSLGDLNRNAPPDGIAWLAQRDALRGRAPELAAFLDATTKHAAHGTTSTREPFRRWALEVSRYSFATGQDVFAARH